MTKYKKIYKCAVEGCNYQAQVYVAFYTLRIEGGGTVAFSRHTCLTHMEDTAIEFSQRIKGFKDAMHISDFTNK